MVTWKVLRSKVTIALLVAVVAGAGIYAACGNDTERVAEPADQLHAGSALPVLAIDIDAKPGACPNPFSLGNDNVKKKTKKKKKKTGNDSTLRVALLGSSTFSPKNVDTSTLWLYTVSTPVRTQFQDVGAGCDSNMPDGYEDLVVYFAREPLIDALKDEGYHAGDQAEIYVRGELLDGTPIEGSDYLSIVGGHVAKKKKK